MYLLLAGLAAVLIFLYFHYIYRKKSVACLMYHNVFNEKTEGIISEEEFEKHMEYIKDMKTYKMEELEEMNYILDEKSILVTFDDGYKNNYKYNCYRVFTIIYKAV